MAGNRSLDEFAEADAGSDEPPETDAGDDEAGPAPKAETLAWSVSGQPCGRCGEAVERRWRDGDELVCADCKAW